MFNPYQLEADFSWLRQNDDMLLHSQYHITRLTNEIRKWQHETLWAKATGCAKYIFYFGSI